ncbi:hypothetical protein [Porphyromonas sp.]
MAEIRVPKSQAEKLDARALKMQGDYLRLLAQGMGIWQVKKALTKKYKVSMVTVYNTLKRAERLTTTTPTEG